MTEPSARKPGFGLAVRLPGLPLFRAAVLEEYGRVKGKEGCAFVGGQDRLIRCEIAPIHGGCELTMLPDTRKQIEALASYTGRQARRFRTLRASQSVVQASLLGAAPDRQRVVEEMRSTARV